MKHVHNLFRKGGAGKRARGSRLEGPPRCSVLRLTAPELPICFNGLVPMGGGRGLLFSECSGRGKIYQPEVVFVEAGGLSFACPGLGHESGGSGVFRMYECFERTFAIMSSPQVKNG